MKLNREATFLCAVVVTMYLSFSTQHVEINAIATSPPHKVAQYLQNDSTIRVRRQTKQRNRGFFSLVYDYFVQTTADATNAFRNISGLVSSRIVPKPQGLQVNTTDPDFTTEMPANNSSTTASTFLLTQGEFFRLFRRNLRGLERLFNRESRKAIEDSNQNVQVLRKQLKDVIRPYIQPANSSNT